MTIASSAASREEMVRDSRRVIEILCASFIFLISAQAVAQVLSPHCGNFEPSTQTAQQVFDEFGDAVISLQVGEDSGSGYLVDAQNGYLLTASHVVKALKGPNPPIVVTHHNIVEGKSLQMRLIKDLSDSGFDIALMQLQPPEALAHVRPTDLVLRVPRAGAPVFIIGFARSEPDVKKRSGTLASVRQDGLLEVQGSAFPGDSGSPLFDEQGKVVGTCVKKINATTALYQPTVDALELLRAIPPSKRMKELDRGVKTRSITQPALASQLTPLSSRPTNTELLSWVFCIIAAPQDYDGAEDLFICPIVHALWHRRLDDAVWLLGSLAPASARARAASEMGSRSASFGSRSKAVEMLASAKELFRGAITEHIRVDNSGALISLCRSGQGRQLRQNLTMGLPFGVSFGEGGWLRMQFLPPTSAAGKDKGKRSEVCEAEAEDREFVDLLSDYAAALDRIGTLETGIVQEIAYLEAADALKLAIGATTDDHHAAGLYEALGRVLIAGGRNAEGASALATAYGLGLGTDTVISEFRRAVAEIEEPRGAFFYGSIESAPKMSPAFFFSETLAFNDSAPSLSPIRKNDPL